MRLLSVALALSQFHGFRLTEEPRRLMVERGLFARLRTSVARRRIQAWTQQEGVLLIIRGLIKKVLLADVLALHLVDPAFADYANQSSAFLVLALIGYSFQVYLLLIFDYICSKEFLDLKY